MAHQTRFFRRRIYRSSPRRVAWHLVRRRHVRIAVEALAELYRRG